MNQLFFNADVYTVDPTRPAATTVAVAGEHLVAVGDVATCRAALTAPFEEIDLGGAALLPGFIDTHLHPTMLLFYDMNVRLRGVRSIAGLQDRLRDIAATMAPGQWLVGLDLDEQDMDEPRLPGRHDLDAACPDRPVFLVKHDGHTTIANTAAIKAAGVTAATPDPPGGRIDREADGFPAGAFRENAAGLPRAAMPIPPIESLVAGGKRTFGRLAAAGITSIGAVLQTGATGPAGEAGAFDVMLLSMLLAEMPWLSVYGLLFADSLADVQTARQSPLHQGERGGHHLGVVKLIADGSLGSHTAYLREPFADRPDTAGFLLAEPDELYEKMAWAHRAGLQLATHAIGDRAVELVADLYERLLTQQPRADHRHRIEHASLLDAELIARLAALGVVVSTQPLFIHTEKHWLQTRLGPERVPWVYPFRSLVDAGVKVAGASDAPVENIDVLHAIGCAVTREGFQPQQGLTAAQAVRLYTADAAFAQFEENVKGSITPGKRADLVVLSANPVKVSADQIAAIRVLRTIRGGVATFQA